MVSGISSAAAAVDSAYARYDSAASAVVAATSPDAGLDTGDIAGAVVQMDESQVALTASLMLLKKSNDMLASVVDLAGYGVEA